MPRHPALAHLKALPGLRREEIPDAAILAREDPTDADGDGIRGVAHRLPGGAIGRFGWKANVPDLRSFVRDAMSNEMGITVPPDATSPFGATADGDPAQDPEIAANDIADIAFFMEMVAFPPRPPATAQTAEGGQLFTQVGCAKCHAPSLDGVEAFTDVLLHDVQPPGFVGVAQGVAVSGLYRTPPLRGLRDTAPYFHDGRSPTVDHAVRRHDGEARAVREAFEALTAAERAALLAFLLGL